MSYLGLLGAGCFDIDSIGYVAPTWGWASVNGRVGKDDVRESLA
jgi:hypothetical protein